jgi:hypothetical protein
VALHHNPLDLIATVEKAVEILDTEILASAVHVAALLDHLVKRERVFARGREHDSIFAFRSKAAPDTVARQLPSPPRC